jgi:hypothetical protein
MFMPATGRAPARGVRPVAGAHAVHAHLYEQRDVYERRAAELAAAQEREAAAGRAHASARSAALAASRRRRRFGHIFAALDADGVGVLDMWAAAEVAAATLHPEIAEDVALAARRAGDAAALDERAFCDAMEATVRAARNGPRSYLGASVTHAPADDVTPCTFAPQLLEKSRVLAAKRRPAGVPLHLSLAREAAAAEARRAMAVAARDAQELAPCTFAPQLVGVPPPASSATQRLRAGGLSRSSAPSGVAWPARPASAPHRASAPPRFMDVASAPAFVSDDGAAGAVPRRFEALAFDLSEALAMRRGAAAAASPGGDNDEGGYDEHAFEKRALAAAARVRARLSQSGGGEPNTRE